MGELDDVERAMLEFESGWWKFQGAKEAAVLERFGLSMTRYYSALNALIDRPAALAYDAMTVRRLQRVRDARRGRRRSRVGVGHPVGL